MASPISYTYFVTLSLFLVQAQCNSLPILCGPGEFTCADGMCVPLEWLCDGSPECPAGDDEPINCTSCAGYEFQCSNKQCILEDWRCDGQQDCGDSSDEANCTVQAQRSCAVNEYSCGDGRCIAIEHLCDGKIDCNNMTDENGSCEKLQCSTNNGGCSHYCQNSPKGPLCWCPQGFVLGQNNQTCQDVDECRDGLDWCSQTCLNTVGNYTCQCHAGYNVTEDGRGCVTEEYHLLFMVNQRLYIKASNSPRPSALLPVPNTGGGMDYDYKTMKVYWVDDMLKSIYRAQLQGLWSDVEIIVQGTGTVDGLAVDWVGRHLYWTDDDRNTIEVAKLSGEYRSTLINTGLDKPKDIALDPLSGYMYWSDWGQVAKIEKSHMDGQNRQVLVSSKITWPSGLALDLPSNRLYWTDPKRGKIESITLNGSSRRSFSVGKSSHPFSIAVLGDNVFWTDSLSRKLERADKRTGEGRIVLLHTGEPITNVRVLHPLLEQQRPSPCHSSRCSHLCLLSPNGFSCACADRSNSTDRHYCLKESFEQSTVTSSTKTSKPLSTNTRPSHTSHRKKTKFSWNNTNKKSNTVTKKNRTNVVHPGDVTTNQIDDFSQLNDTQEILCFHEICKHMGICDEYLRMRNGKDSIRGILTNCTCVERMKGKCGPLMSQKDRARSLAISIKWILLIILLSLVAIIVLLAAITLKCFRKTFLPKSRASYNKGSQRISLRNLPIEDFEFEGEANRPIYNPTTAGYVNPMYAAVSNPVHAALELDMPRPIVLEGCEGASHGHEYPHGDHCGGKFQYSPICEDLVDENENECDGLHQFVNPVYDSPET